MSERSINWLPLVCTLTGNWTHNLDMCLDWESNLQPFGLQDDAPTNWAIPAREFLLLFVCFLKILLVHFAHLISVLFLDHSLSAFLPLSILSVHILQSVFDIIVSAIFEVLFCNLLFLLNYFHHSSHVLWFYSISLFFLVLHLWEFWRLCFKCAIQERIRFLSARSAIFNLFHLMAHINY